LSFEVFSGIITGFFKVINMKRKKHNKALEIVWRAYEYDHHEKTLLWFVIAGVVALGFIVYGLLTDGWTFSLAILAFCVAYYAMHRHEPKIVDIKLNSKGVHIGRHFFSNVQFKNFWIVYDPPHVARLYLRFRSRVRQDLILSIADQDPAEIRRALKAHINEWEAGEEPLVDIFIRLLRL